MINVHLITNYNITLQSVTIGQFLFCMASQRTTAICLGLEFKKHKKGNQARGQKGNAFRWLGKEQMVKERVCKIHYLFVCVSQ